MSSRSSGVQTNRPLALVTAVTKPLIVVQLKARTTRPEVTAEELNNADERRGWNMVVAQRKAAKKARKAARRGA